jgi:hypothetical protein
VIFILRIEELHQYGGGTIDRADSIPSLATPTVSQQKKQQIHNSYTVSRAVELTTVVIQWMEEILHHLGWLKPYK